MGINLKKVFLRLVLDIIHGWRDQYLIAIALAQQ